MSGRPFFMIERYVDEKARFETFLSEPVLFSSEKALELARNGFINWSYGAQTEFLCVFCSIHFKKIKSDSDIVQLHSKKSRNCSIYLGSKYFRNHPTDFDLFRNDALRFENFTKRISRKCLKKQRKINNTSKSISHDNSMKTKMKTNSKKNMIKQRHEVVENLFATKSI
jgi:hypothetical protein